MTSIRLSVYHKALLSRRDFSGSSLICLKSAQLSESPEPEGLFHDTGAINHHLRTEESVSGSLIIGCPHVYRNQAVGLIDNPFEFSHDLNRPLTIP